MVGLYFIAPIKYNKLASFKRNKKRLSSVRQLKRPTRRFSGNYKRKRRGVYWKNGRHSVYRIRYNGTPKLRQKSFVYKKLKKLNKLRGNYRAILRRLGS